MATPGLSRERISIYWIDEETGGVRPWRSRKEVEKAWTGLDPRRVTLGCKGCYKGRVQGNRAEQDEHAQGHREWLGMSKRGGALEISNRCH